MSNSLNMVALWVVHLVLCLGVVGAAICRVDEMSRKRNKWSWFAMYALYAVFALAVLLETLKTGEWSPVYLIGLSAVACNLVATLPNWRAGPPPLSCRPECEP